jgi:lysophospholipase L1-like esterase
MSAGHKFQHLALKISIALNVIFLILFAIFLVRNHEKVLQKLVLIKGEPEVIMFGDSHTANANWSSLLWGYDAVEFGYPGFTSGQLKDKLMSNVLKYQPVYCFIHAGGNDISSDCYDRNTLIAILEEMIDSLQRHSIRPVVESLFFRFDDPVYNAEVDSINTSFRELAAMKKVAFLNINENLVDDNGLKKELTIDGIHLNRKGYDIWAKQVKSFLSIELSPHP